MKRNVRSEGGAGAGSLQQEPERATTAHHAEQGGYGIVVQCTASVHANHTRSGGFRCAQTWRVGECFLATDDQHR